MTVASSEKVQARLQILDERLARLRAERDRLVARASRAERKRETRAHTSAERTSWLSMPQKLKRNVNAANPNTAAALDVRTRTAMVVLWASPGFLVTPVGLVPAGRGGPDRNVIHITNLHTLARGCTASQRVHADLGGAVSEARILLSSVGASVEPTGKAGPQDLTSPMKPARSTEMDHERAAKRTDRPTDRPVVPK